MISSYIARLLHFQSVSARTFSKSLLGKPALFYQDIDLNFDKRDLKIINEYYGLNNGSTLKELIRWIQTNIHIYHVDPSILPLTIRGGKRTSLGQQYCPKCLNEHCYYKQQWRLSIYPACLKHKCILLNKCPFCNGPIDPLRVSPMLKDIGYCAYCWKNLRSASIKEISSYPLLLNAINESLNTGWFEYNGLKLRAILFIRGFWRLVYCLYGIRSRKKRIWEGLVEKYGGTNNLLSETTLGSHIQVESPINRFNIIEVIDRLLYRWPRQFIKVAEELNITLSLIDPAKRGLPYWLDSVARGDLNKDWYKVNEEEVQSALVYMLKNNIRITRASLAKTLGLDLSKKLSARELNLVNRFQSLQ